MDDNVVMGSLIRVDRSQEVVYPNFVVEIICPELEATGPSRYNLSKQVEEWFHPHQLHKGVRGPALYRYLRKKNLLAGCLGLSDALAIQCRGVNFFRKHFKYSSVYFWKSMVRNCEGNLVVPFLQCLDQSEEVTLDWDWIGNGRFAKEDCFDWEDFSWNYQQPALRFK